MFITQEKLNELARRFFPHLTLRFGVLAVLAALGIK
jgi:hypothetical protein